MKYWPLSQLALSELLPWQHAAAVYELQHRGRSYLPHGAIGALGYVASHLPAADAPQLTIIESANADHRHIYLDYPGIDEWLRLERSGVLLDDAGVMHMVIDALH